MIIIRYLPEILSSYWKELLGFIILAIAMLVVNIHEEVDDAKGSSIELFNTSLQKDARNGTQRENV